MKYEYFSHEFAPIYSPTSKLLILGSFPSVKSREQSFYYGHPQNRFWKLLAHLYNEEIPNSISSKKDFLIRHDIALWDVIASCEIKGSSDSSIRNVIPNDISTLLQQTSINYIYANGAKAATLYNKYIFPNTKQPIIKLPSTSPANAAYTLDKLEMHWQQIAKPSI